jgi:hypothetical protein|nr:hypothetical protein [Kofleriaceae bacterium]
MKAFVVFALASVACSSSPSSPDTSSGGGASLTCQNGTGPESVACDQCGQAQCGSDHDTTVSSCATMVSCIEACQCDSNDTCLSGCIDAASTDCQADITAYADCEKMDSVCGSSCSD